jgi:flagellum-specific ATP synthase
MQEFKSTYSRYQQNRDLINVGAYQAGSDASIDYSIKMQPEFKAFLSQDMKQPVNFMNSYSQLESILQQSDLLSGQGQGQQAIQAPAGPSKL